VPAGQALKAGRVAVMEVVECHVTGEPGDGSLRADSVARSQAVLNVVAAIPASRWPHLRPVA